MRLILFDLVVCGRFRFQVSGFTFQVLGTGDGVEPEGFFALRRTIAENRGVSGKNCLGPTITLQG
jgi:hypothetical protein